MFEITKADQNSVTIATKENTITFNLAEASVDAGLEVGAIVGPGEFEIGNISIRGIAINQDRTIYDVEISGVHVGIIGDYDDTLDELGISDVLCTSSLRAIREIEPKMVVATGNVDAMVAELKVTARTEKKLKIKKADALPATLEVVVLS